VRAKRLLIYVLIAVLGGAAVLVFSWHSQNWKEKSTKTSMVEQVYFLKIT
jgi:flagellar basal body-associated protein FliL